MGTQVAFTGEIEVFEAMWPRKQEILRAGITAVPGAGFDVVPTDCLARYVAGKLEHPVSLIIALCGLESASQGTVRTAIRLAEGLGALFSSEPSAQNQRVRTANQ